MQTVAPTSRVGTQDTRTLVPGPEHIWGLMWGKVESSVKGGVCVEGSNLKRALSGEGLCFFLFAANACPSARAP